MKKEAKIILPTSPSRISPEAAKIAHYDLRADLCKTFGGYTATTGHGGWIDGNGNCINEPVTIYTFAAEDDYGTRGLITAFAEHVRERTSEDCIYVTYPNGVVNLI